MARGRAPAPDPHWRPALRSAQYSTGTRSPTCPPRRAAPRDCPTPRPGRARFGSDQTRRSWLRRSPGARGMSACSRRSLRRHGSMRSGPSLGPRPSDAVRPCDAPARRSDDSRLLTGSPGAVRAHVRHPLGTPAQGARRTRHRHDARGEPLARRALPFSVQ